MFRESVDVERVLGLFRYSTNQPVLYGEHTNIQCIAVFNGVEGAKP